MSTDSEDFQTAFPGGSGALFRILINFHQYFMPPAAFDGLYKRSVDFGRESIFIKDPSSWAPPKSSIGVFRGDS